MQPQRASSHTKTLVDEDRLESRSPSQPEQRQEPPGRTPDTPPPLATPETEPIPQPKATPDSEAKPVSSPDDEPERSASESLYGEDLPPDFWDSDPVADVDTETVAQNEPRPDEVAFEVSSRPTPRSVPRQEVAGKLTDDPRFEVMQSLFPGQIVEWQDSEEVEEGGADNLSDDPEENADGLDLETDT